MAGRVSRRGLPSLVQRDGQRGEGKATFDHQQQQQQHISDHSATRTDQLTQPHIPPPSLTQQQQRWPQVRPTTQTTTIRATRAQRRPNRCSTRVDRGRMGGESAPCVAANRIGALESGCDALGVQRCDRPLIASLVLVFPLVCSASSPLQAAAHSSRFSLSWCCSETVQSESQSYRRAEERTAGHTDSSRPTEFADDRSLFVSLCCAVLAAGRRSCCDSSRSRSGRGEARMRERACCCCDLFEWRSQ